MNAADAAWRAEALCATAPNPDVFIDNDDGGQWKVAKSYCDACPVVGQCLEFASTHLIPHGVFGGETPGARRRRLGINEHGEPIRRRRSEAA